MCVRVLPYQADNRCLGGVSAANDLGGDACVAQRSDDCFAKKRSDDHFVDVNGNACVETRHTHTLRPSERHSSPPPIPHTHCVIGWFLSFAFPIFPGSKAFPSARLAAFVQP